MVTFKGNPMTLEGKAPEVGQRAPDFTALDTTMGPVRLSDFLGKVVIISTTPSLDTPVCEIQAKRFNEEAAGFNGRILNVSMDLPFAAKRFCAANEATQILTLSDFRDRDFATKYGLRIQELGLLARAIFVIDREGKVIYREIVEEVASQPDFDKALAVAREAAGA